MSLSQKILKYYNIKRSLVSTFFLFMRVYRIYFKVFVTSLSQGLLMLNVSYFYFPFQRKSLKRPI